MTTAFRTVRRFGHRLHRPWPWHRSAGDLTGDHACPACDGHGIIRASDGWHNCPRCGFGDQA